MYTTPDLQRSSNCLMVFAGLKHTQCGNRAYYKLPILSIVHVHVYQSVCSAGSIFASLVSSIVTDKVIMIEH